MGDLANKVAILTGGGGGIGRGIAEVLARESATVVVTDVSLQAASRVADVVKGKGARSLALAHDVSTAASSEAVVRQTLETFGQIDILVNNAGVAQYGPSEQIEEAVWDRIFDVNAKGVFLMCKLVLPHMMQRRYGKIINMSSMVGKQNDAGVVAYGASKFAVVGITQSLAKEFGQYNINVNAVCPGRLKTPMLETIAEEFSQMNGISIDEAWRLLTEEAPLKRLQDTQDIGEVVAFLVSEKARNITGQSISVDGGLRMY